MCFSSAFFPRFQLDEDVGAGSDTHHAADILHLGQLADLVARPVHQVKCLVGGIARWRRKIGKERAHILVGDETRGQHYFFCLMSKRCVLHKT